MTSFLLVFRYQRGSRSLADNIKQGYIANKGMMGGNITTENDEEYDIPDEVEDVIGEIRYSVRYMVRYIVLWK